MHLASSISPTINNILWFSSRIYGRDADKNAFDKKIKQLFTLISNVY